MGSGYLCPPGSVHAAVISGFERSSALDTGGHIAILERAGLVTKQRVGRRKVVRTNLERLRLVRRLLDQYEELWRGRIDRMTELMSDPKERDR